jgi:hypothetical protein
VTNTDSPAFPQAGSEQSIEIHPEPSPAELTAILTALQTTLSVWEESDTAESSIARHIYQPSRWKMAGRTQALKSFQPPLEPR